MLLTPINRNNKLVEMIRYFKLLFFIFISNEILIEMVLQILFFKVIFLIL